jgi:DNA-directed RNA polymerase subunit alpha
VKRVRYKVEATRVGKLTNYDKLILEIWTDQTVSPEMALVEASKIYRKHLNPFVNYTDTGPICPWTRTSSPRKPISTPRSSACARS